MKLTRRAECESGAEVRIALIIGLVLMVATYLAFSLRTAIDPVNPGDWLSAKRLLTVASGAGLFLLVAAQLRHDARRLSGRMRSLMLTIAAGLAALFALRLGYDWLSGETQAAIARNVRWLLAWTGYFAAAVAAYVAALYFRTGAVPASRNPAEEIAAIVSQWPEERQRRLLVELTQPPRYEEADPDPLRRVLLRD